MDSAIARLASIENDPLAKWAVFKSSPVVHQLAYYTGLPYLPDHLHEILLSAFLHFFVYMATDVLLNATTKWYPKLTRAVKTGVRVHASSEVNALLSLVLSFPLFFSYKLDSLVSYTPYAGLVAAVLSGYFLFDIAASIFTLEYNGWGFLLHACAAFLVFIQGNRPFMHNYSAAYIWYEASTPFVNFNWFLTNVPGLFSNKVKTINGALLIIVFMLCRVIPGPINGYRLFRVALTTDLPGVPQHIVIPIFVCYTVLSGLNLFWFGLMLSIAYNVLFTEHKSQAEAVLAAAEVNPDDTTTIHAPHHSTTVAPTKTTTRRRRKV